MADLTNNSPEPEVDIDLDFAPQERSWSPPLGQRGTILHGEDPIVTDEAALLASPRRHANHAPLPARSPTEADDAPSAN
jgi:hypothetical protein